MLTSNPDRPEYTSFAQNNPIGHLGPDMRHRANVWLRYDIPTPIGNFNLSLLNRFHSALSYSAVGTIDVRRGVANGPADGIVNPGYQTVPSSVSYFFGERGAFRVDDINSTDLGVNYSLPLGRTNLFVEADLLNMFNEQGIEDPDFVDRTVRTRTSALCLQNPTTRCVAFNPFREEPVEGVHWQKGPIFGQPIQLDAYQNPRTYRVSLGVRF